jgi:hypothetical protein
LAEAYISPCRQHQYIQYKYLSIFQNNPLHISLFPATGSGYEAERNKLEYSFMLNSCLDIFEARIPTKTIGHDFGLLHALDERIAMYGWVTNTGVKLVIVVDMEGRPASSTGPGKAAILGLKDRDLAPVCEHSCPCGPTPYTNHLPPGFPRAANCIHPPFEKPILRA